LILREGITTKSPLEPSITFSPRTTKQSSNVMFAKARNLFSLLVLGKIRTSVIFTFSLHFLMQTIDTAF